MSQNSASSQQPSPAGPAKWIPYTALAFTNDARSPAGVLQAASSSASRPTVTFPVGVASVSGASDVSSRVCEVFADLAAKRNGHCKINHDMTPRHQLLDSMVFDMDACVRSFAGDPDYDQFDAERLPELAAEFDRYTEAVKYFLFECFYPHRKEWFVNFVSKNEPNKGLRVSAGSRKRGQAIDTALSLRQSDSPCSSQKTVPAFISRQQRRKGDTKKKSNGNSSSAKSPSGESSAETPSSRKKNNYADVDHVQFVEASPVSPRLTTKRKGVDHGQPAEVALVVSVEPEVTIQDSSMCFSNDYEHERDVCTPGSAEVPSWLVTGHYSDFDAEQQASIALVGEPGLTAVAGVASNNLEVEEHRGSDFLLGAFRDYPRRVFDVLSQGRLHSPVSNVLSHFQDSALGNFFNEDLGIDPSSVEYVNTDQLDSDPAIKKNPRLGDAPPM